jgi:hypothetical protein
MLVWHNKMNQSYSFFIAGTIQGARHGTSGIDQGYRSILQQVILRTYPNSVIHCPLELLRKRFTGRLEQALAAYAQETAAEVLDSDKYSPLVCEIRSAFVDLTHMAAQCDVLIAYLPDHEASMGTAMEMWSAYSHDRIIITISSMTQNLALVATSTVLLPSIDLFEDFLSSARLDDLIGKRRA